MGNLGYGFCPTHPGEIVKDEIKYRGISQREIAGKIGMPYSVLNEILNGKRTITEETALFFEAVLGVEADTLMRLQIKYNMQIARKNSKVIAKINEMQKIAAVF